MLVTIGVSSSGEREPVGRAEGYTGSADSWRKFLSWLRERGLSGVCLGAGDKCTGMLGAPAEVFPGTRYRHCTVHFYRNVLWRAPATKRKEAARMLKAVHAQESREACERKAAEVASSLDEMRLGAAVGVVRDGGPRRYPTPASRPRNGAASGPTMGASE